MQNSSTCVSAADRPHDRGNASLFYRSPLAYRLLMKCLYGPAYRERLRRAASWVRHGDHVVDLCAGDGSFFDIALRDRGVRYTAVEMSPAFAERLAAKGITVVTADVRTWTIPPCDVMACLTSLYQFPECLERFVDRARTLGADLVVLEPVANVAQSSSAPIRRLAAALTDFGEGPVAFRFSEPDLRARCEVLGADVVERMGRDLLAVWRFRPERTS